jgi:1-acyl-sn-glycerol-3-phosphate acyltransferase
MYRILLAVAHLLIFICTRPTVKGRNLIPAGGPLLLVSNHLSVADPVLLGAKIGRKVSFMAKEELFRNWFTTYMVTSFGAILVYRGKSNRGALRQASAILRNGGVLGMFPEGKRSRAGTLTPGQLGAALIAYHNKVRILPVSITGTETIRGKEWLFHRPRVEITIGTPFYLPDLGVSLRKEQLRELTDIIMYRIAALLPAEYQGQYLDGSKNGNHPG